MLAPVRFVSSSQEAGQSAGSTPDIRNQNLRDSEDTGQQRSYYAAKLTELKFPTTAVGAHAYVTRQLINLNKPTLNKQLMRRSNQFLMKDYGSFESEQQSPILNKVHQRVITEESPRRALVAERAIANPHSRLGQTNLRQRQFRSGSVHDNNFSENSFSDAA